MATITPSWSENAALFAITTLAKGNSARALLDLRTKWGAWVSVLIGRGGTTALTNGVVLLARRTQGADATLYPAPAVEVRSQSAAAASTTCAASGNNAGQNTLTVASASGFAVDDLILVQDASTPTSASEWARIIKIASNTFTLDRNLVSAHNNTAHTVRNKADAWLFWLDGGADWEIIIDYGDDSAGEDITYKAMSQTLDSIQSA